MYLTQKDIDGAVRGDCTNCPIARAIKRTLAIPYCEVDEVHILLLYFDGKQYNIPTTPHVAKAIMAFDQGHNLLPGEFVLNFRNRTRVN